jgi:hypothetical protein
MIQIGSLSNGNIISSMVTNEDRHFIRVFDSKNNFTLFKKFEVPKSLSRGTPGHGLGFLPLKNEKEGTLLVTYIGYIFIWDISDYTKP